MTWKINYLRSAQKNIRTIDRAGQQRIKAFLEDRLVALDDPRKLGKALRGEHLEIWRYRVGPYRILCDIQDETLTVLVVRVGHRGSIYR